MAINSCGKEIGRKVIHLCALMFLALYFIFAARFGPRAGLLSLSVLLVLLLILECIRLQYRIRIPLISCLYTFRRQRELEGALGAEVYFLLGVIVSLCAFDLNIAVAAVLMTVFGDLTAAVVGRRYGRLKPEVFGGKSIEGSAAALLVNLAIGYLILRTGPDNSAWWQCWLEQSGGYFSSFAFGETIWQLVVVISVAAALTELCISKIDDNLTIPVISGFAGQLTLLLMA